MSADPSSGASVDHRSLATTLAPVLRESTDNRLGEIEWFKADWQRGGAATGRSTFAHEDGTEAPVIVKLPVVRREIRWTVRLQRDPDVAPLADTDDLVVPRLFASGSELAGYDIAWLVMEQFEHGPLGLTWHDDHVDRIADATARFHARCAPYAVDEPPRVEDWDALLEESVESLRVNPVDDRKRWNDALRTFRQRLATTVEEWRARATDQWLHGDIHLANAMSRVAMDHGPVALIDLAEMHAGNWIEDAVYLERQLWARPERLKEHKPVRAIAKARRALGLPVEDGWPRLAMIRRALLAASAPRFIRSEGNPHHLHACLEWLERALPELR